MYNFRNNKVGTFDNKECLMIQTILGGNYLLIVQNEEEQIFDYLLQNKNSTKTLLINKSNFKERKELFSIYERLILYLTYSEETSNIEGFKNYLEKTKFKFRSELQQYCVKKSESESIKCFETMLWLDYLEDLTWLQFLRDSSSVKTKRKEN